MTLYSVFAGLQDDPRWPTSITWLDPTCVVELCCTIMEIRTVWNADVRCSSLMSNVNLWVHLLYLLLLPSEFFFLRKIKKSAIYCEIGYGNKYQVCFLVIIRIFTSFYIIISYICCIILQFILTFIGIL